MGVKGEGHYPRLSARILEEMDSVALWLSGKSDHFPDHSSNAIVDLMNGGIAHEGAGGHQLVLRIHVDFGDVLVHMLAAELLHGLSSLGVRPPARRKENKPCVGKPSLHRAI